jgi:hypothetical protein
MAVLVTSGYLANAQKVPIPRETGLGNALLPGPYHIPEGWITQRVPIPHTANSSIQQFSPSNLGVIPPKPLPGSGGGGGPTTIGYAV